MSIKLNYESERASKLRDLYNNLYLINYSINENFFKSLRNK